MKGQSSDPQVRRRIALSVLLVAVAALCGLALLLVPASRREPAQRGGGDAMIARAIDSLFARYGVGKNDVATWRVSTPDRRFSRIEQRVYVPPRFLSLQFNHDLASLVAPAGARVVGTERAKEQIVTLHIVVDGLTVRTIAFVTREESRE